MAKQVIVHHSFAKSLLEKYQFSDIRCLFLYASTGIKITHFRLETVAHFYLYFVWFFIIL